MLSFSVDRLSWLCFLWLIAAVITIDIQGNMVNTHGMRIRHREQLNDLPRLDPVTRQFNLPELDRARLLPAIPFSSTPAGVATHPTIHNPNPPPASTISDRTRWYQPPDEVNAADPTTEAELKIDYSRLKPAHPNVKHRFNVPPAVTIPKGVDYNTYLTYLSHFRHIPLNANPKDKRYVLDPPPPPIVVRPPPTPKPEPPPPEPEPEPEAAEPEPEPEPEPEEQPPPGEKPAPRPKRTPKKKAPAKRPAKKQQPKKKPPKRIIKNPIPPDSPRRQRQSVWVREVVERKAPGQVLWDSLPDVRPQTSTRYKRWWKLVDRGYGGGEAERALALENDDPDRAAVRLARDYSGYDGLHCLGKGNCFGDPRQAIFKTPRPTAVPEMPPSMQAPPPWENKKKSSTNGGNKKSRGVDYSSQLLKHQRRNRDPSNFKFSKKKGQAWSERRPPVLDPFKRVTPLPHEIEDHKFDNAPLRGSSLGTSEEKDAFTKLMRSWLLTIQSPFHTRKPDSTHESDANFPKMPSDTHAPIVPVKMQMRTDDQQGVQHLTVEWHQPPTYQAQTLAQLKASLERQSVLQRIRDERASVVITGRANNANHRPDPPAAPTPVAPSTPPTDGATPSDATPAPSEGLTPAQEQDAELEAGIGQQSQEQDQTQP